LPTNFQNHLTKLKIVKLFQIIFNFLFFIFPNNIQLFMLIACSVFRQNRPCRQPTVSSRRQECSKLLSS